MLPPGPRTPPFWQTLRFLSAPREYSLEVSARYGKVSRFHGLNGRGVAIADPDLVREVFGTDPDLFIAPPVLSDLLGRHSVLATSGAIHRRQRKLLNPSFHGTRIRTFLGALQGVVREHSSRLHRVAGTGEVLVMTDFAQALTLDAILETVFGEGAEIDRGEGRRVVVEVLRAMSPTFVFTRALRTRAYPPWRGFVRRRAAFDAWVDRAIAERRGREEPGADVLGTLVDARYDDGEAVENAEIRDQIMTLLLAGHETTAVAVAWGVYWLLREPAVLARLRQDIETLGDDPAAEALVRLPYLQAVLWETLRIEPVVTDVGRLCRSPVRLGPWTVPAGQHAIINVSALFENEALFPEPRRFRPERFLERTFSPAQFLPFGGGHRRCLGASFAEAELALALGTLASEWHLAPATDEPERPARRNITMGPKHGVRVKVLGPRLRGARSREKLP